ncbi:MAG: ThuA domain-containing protein [Kiritimatiellaeota bacterium]|nr:ThuA domain-containing protein [Kiritimatiellota bacterium]
MNEKKIRVTVWNENCHETTNADIRAIYPQGMHGTIAAFLEKAGDIAPRTATLDEPEHGLTEAVLNETDVLIWWGHCRHNDVQDDIVARVQKRVLEGMGLCVLHSGHLSKIFRALMGTSCTLIWRVADEKERLWVIEPSHPIVRGLGKYFELPKEEMYGERFDIPRPDCLVLASWFQGGELFRSGCCWRRGHGKIFYFRPGHESYPTYHDANVQTVITNAVRWLVPEIIQEHTCPHSRALEPLPS